MPTRLLKDSICTSKDINRLSSEEEVFFYRLIVNCDDYGYLEADPGILRSRCFPRKIDLITDANICQWLQSLVSGEMVEVFESGNNFYLRMPSWERHQQIRAKRRKYPELVNGCRILQASEIICKHLITDANKCPRNPIQSNPVVIQSESSTGGVGGVTAAFLESIKPRFPGIDIQTEWEDCQRYWKEHKRKMKAPQTALVNWLKRVNKGGTSATEKDSRRFAGLPGNRPAGAFDHLANRDD